MNSVYELWLYIDIRLNDLRKPIGEVSSTTYDPVTSLVDIVTRLRAVLLVGV
jgi:hypothetical protein